MKKISLALILVLSLLCGCKVNEDKTTNKVEGEIKVEENSKNYSWDELSYEEYLQEAEDEKGLDEEQLRTLKHMGFTRAEIQEMTNTEALNHIEAWMDFCEEYHEGLITQHFEGMENWQARAKSEDFVWTDGKTTINADLLNDFVKQTDTGDADIIILYIDRIYNLRFEIGSGVTLTAYYKDETKEDIACDGIEETEIGYILKGTDIVINK